MDWTEDEEDALLAYLRDIKNNQSFWKRNTKREKAFKDCAIFLSRQSEQRRHFEAEDVKAFCTYLVEERYRLEHSNLSHLFRTGLFRKKNGKTCDIFTREECRKFAEEDKARERGLPIPEEPEETTAPSLKVSESVTRRGARYKSTDWETNDGENLSNTARKRRKSEHPTPVAERHLLSVTQEQDRTPALPQGSSHLMYKHRHMDGAEIGQKFAELENHIVVAADRLLSGDNSRIRLNCLHRYGKDDFRLLKSILTNSVVQSWDSFSHFQTVQALIGLCIFQWIFEDYDGDADTYGYPSREAVEAVWFIRFEQYDKGMLNPLFSILKDAYFWQTTQTKFLDVLLPKRARELSDRLSTLLGTLFEIDVPRCSTEHSTEQERRRDCYSWSCQVEAIFLDALDLCVKLRQRDHKTVFRWPAIGDKYDETFMQHEEESVANQHSMIVVRATLMPAVIDQRDSEDPSAIGGGVWYKAMVCLASAAEVGKLQPLISTLNQDKGREQSETLTEDEMTWMPFINPPA